MSVSPPKIHVEALTLSVMVLRDVVFGALTIGLVPL